MFGATGLHARSGVQLPEPALLAPPLPLPPLLAPPLFELVPPEPELFPALPGLVPPTFVWPPFEEGDPPLPSFFESSLDEQATSAEQNIEVESNPQTRARVVIARWYRVAPSARAFTPRNRHFDGPECDGALHQRAGFSALFAALCGLARRSCCALAHERLTGALKLDRH